MSFEWDPQNARTNAQKHGIEFADAVAALEDEGAITVQDEEAADEQRFVTLGRDGFDRLLVVVYTWRGENIRLISARKATKHERETYEG